MNPFPQFLRPEPIDGLVQLLMDGSDDVGCLDGNRHMVDEVNQHALVTDVLVVRWLQATIPEPVASPAGQGPAP